MFRKLVFVLISGIASHFVSAQCTADFSFTANSTSLQFTNLSTTQDIHFYWNFGDGTSSFEINPLHEFPESGKYIVSLYLRDTISGCHTVKDSLIEVTKQSTDPCTPSLNYNYYTGNFSDLLQVNDVSQNCNNFFVYLNAGPAMNFPPNNSVYIDSSWMPANFIGSIRYTTLDSINGYAVKRAYYATMPYHYTSTLNYDSCSANFEFWVDYLPNNALLHFRGMDPYQTSYDFVITGMGNPIHLYSNNATYAIPYISGILYYPWLIGSYSTSSSGCQTSCWQQILIKNPSFTEPPTCAITMQPEDQVAQEGSDLMIITQTDNRTVRQWQMDDGTGFVNLTNAGHYSGVNSDTLLIENVTMEMNHYRYRCITSYQQSSCHNTSDVALLTVENNYISLYPVPAHDLLNIVFTDYRYNSSVFVYNQIGQKILETEIVGQSGTIELYNYQSGLYIIEVVTNGVRYFAKFSKD